MADRDRAYWDKRYQQEWPREPSSFLLAQRHLLPGSGRALDVAGGVGRHAIWLAGQGLRASVVDISSVALGLAQKRAAEAGVLISTLCRNLDTEPLPPCAMFDTASASCQNEDCRNRCFGAWEIICNFYYLQRALIPTFAQHLAPGGLLIFAHATRENLTRHPRPGPDYVLEPGELADLASGLKHLYYKEDWFEEGRHEARLVAQRQFP